METAMSPAPERPRRSDFRFVWPLAVRWGDMDALGHVNNAAYCTYLESARIGFFARRGWSFPSAARGAPLVVTQTINYREAVVYPAALEIGVRCAEVRNRSFVLVYALFREGTETVAGDGTTVLVWVDGATGRPASLPDEVRSLLQDDPA
jgi:acyl-CoA thioester hydrolase